MAATILYSRSAIDQTGNVYAGGDFTTAGGVSANHVARWDGTSWSPLGNGVGGEFYVTRALAVDDTGSVYAAANYDFHGTRSLIVTRWNGTEWTTLSSASGPDGCLFVKTLVFDQSGNLYAGGCFAHIGGISASGIAMWNGSTWSPLGSEISSTVHALAVGQNGTTIYAGGSFTTAGGVPANYVARWNGSSWSPLGSGVAGGDFDTHVLALSVDQSDNVFAGGSFTAAGGTPVNNIARWDGSLWHPLGNGIDDTINVLASRPGGLLFAGGNSTRPAAWS